MNNEKCKRFNKSVSIQHRSDVDIEDIEAKKDRSYL